MIRMNVNAFLKLQGEIRDAAILRKMGISQSQRWRIRIEKAGTLSRNSCSISHNSPPMFLMCRKRHETALMTGKYIFLSCMCRKRHKRARAAQSESRAMPFSVISDSVYRLFCVYGQNLMILDN